MYVIIKNIEDKRTKKILPVILLNKDSEIWEFDTEEDAEKMKEIFQTNSDSNHKYEVKKL